ncbi:MAG: DUF4837 family protein [Gemmatimonadota bacterium]
MYRTRFNPVKRPGRPAVKGGSSPVSFVCALFVATLGGVSACDAPTAFGEADSLIVVADSALWAEMERETYDTLEPTLFTVRPEATFHVTHVSRDGSELEQLLMWRQVVVFAETDDPLLREIADNAGVEEPPAAGEIVQAEDVWARGQLATGIVLDPERRAESWSGALPELAETLDRQFRQYATSRMWVSGVDTAFAAELARRHGVTMRAPQIYHGSVGEDGVVRLRNDRPSPADRIRSILAQPRERLDSLTADAVYEWRAGVDSVMYNVAQEIERGDVPPERFEVGGAEAVQVQGVWRDEAEYPAAGVFIARAVQCPEATWFFDAWLYSPHPEDSKYEYVLQLEEILDSFRCTTDSTDSTDSSPE